MKTTIQEFVSNKKLPKFLAKNKVLLSFDKVDKIFPKLGLPNCSGDVEIDNSTLISKSARDFIAIIVSYISDASYRFAHYNEYYYPCIVNDDIKNIGFITANFYNWLTYDYTYASIMHNDNGKMSLKIPADIEDGNHNVVFKKGQSLFKVYSNLYKSIEDLRCPIKLTKLDDIPEFKRFSSDNIPNNNFQIVFSSDGLDGMWDISTMSMRGIQSCQSWTGQYKHALVGSIVDPFVGVIYLTSGTNINDLGTKMIRRSLVRFVVDTATKKPFLLVDRMYPEYDVAIVEKFIAFLKARVSDKLDVVFGPHLGYEKVAASYIPEGKIHGKLTAITKSYRDTKIQWKSDIIDPVAVALDKLISGKQTKFRNILRNTSFTTISEIKKSPVKFKNDDTKKSINIILRSDDFKYLVRDYYIAVANIMIDTLPKNDIHTSKEYMKNLCFHYIKNRNTSITTGTKAAFTKNINTYFAGNTTKINSAAISRVLKTVQKAIDDKLKAELKKILVKKTAASKLPN